MNDDSSELNRVEQLGEEFVSRLRRGERPTITEYVKAHPNLAARIERIFPMMMFAEQMGGVPTPPVQSSQPKQLGEYRIVRELGRGGMGVVYEAVQESLGRHVALKVLPSSEANSPSFRARFDREARAAAKLHHPNIVPVFGVGEENDVHYYAMQFIHGRGLDSVLREMQRQRGRATTQAGNKTPDDDTGQLLGPTSAECSSPANLSSLADASYYHGVARMGLQVAQALDYAHRAGIQHRDIKPSNLLMDAVGTVWVADFGLAKTDDDGGLTSTGEFVGTLRYMAPERFKGESTPAADIYALGVTLYELLTLRPAFQETDRAKLMQQVINDEPPAPRQIDRRMPRDLETIILKAIAKEPVHRYLSAGDLAEDLRLFVADQPIRARRPPLYERTWRWCRRNPRLAGVLAVAAALLLVILIGSPLMTLRVMAEKRSALEQLFKAHVAEAAALRSTSEAGRRVNGLISLDSAHRLREHLPRNADRDLLLRNSYLASLSLADLGQATPGLPWKSDTVAMTFDTTFGRYAVGDLAGGITICRFDSRTELLKLPAIGIDARALKFSPNGRYLAAGYHTKYTANSQKFRVWDLEKGTAIVQVDAETGCGEADFSADSRWLAYGADQDKLVIRDLANLNSEPRVLTVSGLPSATAWHADGTKIAVAAGRTVEVCDLAAGKTTWTQNMTGDVWSLAWHPNGKTLAVASGPTVILSQEGNTAPMATLRGHDNLVYAVAFNRAGTMLASKSHDGTVRLWDVASRQLIVRAECIYSGCVPLQFSPDDRNLAFGADGHTAWLWDVVPGVECRTWPVPDTSSRWIAASARFSPDGRLVAVVGTDALRLWNWHEGREVARLPAGNGWSTAFLPDGAGLLTTGRAGLQLWPLKTSSNQITVGPAGDALTNGPAYQADLSGDGRVMVTRQPDGVTIVWLREKRPPVRLPPIDGVRFVAINHDGTLVATGTQNRKDVKIWSTADGILHHEIAIEGHATVGFSPNGQTLAIGTERDYAFFDTRTWKLVQRRDKEPENMGADVSYSADGRLLVLRHAPTLLHLVDPTNGELLAELRSPVRKVLMWHLLSPDGSKLLAGGYGNALFAWDLGAMRRQLAERKLDWADFGTRIPDAPAPLRVTVEK